MSEALANRIAAEELAKSQTCASFWCENQATHTNGGWPQCDKCGTPGRQQLDSPRILGDTK